MFDLLGVVSIAILEANDHVDFFVVGISPDADFCSADGGLDDAGAGGRVQPQERSPFAVDLEFQFGSALDVFIHDPWHVLVTYTQNLFVGLKERVFFDTLPNFVIYVENVVPTQSLVKGVFISDQTLSDLPVYYFAEEGEVHGNAETGTITLLLKNGAIHRSEGTKGLYQVARFERYRVNVNVAQMLMPRAGKGRKRQMEELTLPELRQEIMEGAHEEKDARKLRLNYHQRLAFPFAALVFCALGVPLALLSQQAVRYTGFSLSIVVMLLFFVLMQLGSGLTFAGYIPASLGAWLPNLVLGTLGAYLTWRKAEEKPLKVLDAYTQLVRDIQESVPRRFRNRF